MKISPPALKSGDLVSLVAPSGRLRTDNLDVAVALLQSWGLRVNLGQYLWEGDRIFAASDAHRAADLQAALDAREVKAIFCVRGGYGITRIIDGLCFLRFSQQPKWLVGFSDITALQLHLLGLGFQSLHASMPAQYADYSTSATLNSIRAALFGTPLSLSAPPLPHNRKGIAEGTLLGGNLCLLCDALATPSAFDTEGAILFLEEINEPPYKLDRMITQLKRAGKLDKLAGLMVGFISYPPDEDEAANIHTAYDLLAENLQDYDFPLGFSFSVGHKPHNIALVQGAKVRLEVENEGAKMLYLNDFSV